MRFPYMTISATPRILAAMTLAMPTGETHMISSTILMITWKLSGLGDQETAERRKLGDLVNDAEEVDEGTPGGSEGAEDGAEGQAEEYHAQGVRPGPGGEGGVQEGWREGKRARISHL